MTGQAWLSYPASLASWLAGLGKEGWGGSDWEEFRPSPFLGLRGGGRSLARRHRAPLSGPLCKAAGLGFLGVFTFEE